MALAPLALPQMASAEHRTIAAQLGTAASGAASDASGAAPGVFALDIRGAEARALSLTLWYPAEPGPESDFAGNAVFRGTRAIPGAAPHLAAPDSRFPVVLISHGGLRSAADSGAWLAAGLARAGYLAVEVNAPRTADARAALDEIWRRPQDMSRALDHLLRHPEWAGRIDPDQIFAVGFALGGTAALTLAGMGPDAEGYLQSCENAGQGNPDCGWLAAQGVSPEQTDAAALDADRHDPRFRAAIAIAPEYLPVLDVSNGIDAPALVVSLGPDIPSGAARLPDGVAQMTLPQAGPTDGFALCTEAGPQILARDGGNPALCGASSEARADAHRVILAAITAFLQDADAHP
ncbi:hypothetical protein JI664_11820 [Rhodobacter sp. NTK016B]|uniref:alpha/beta hydrolase family protein n=1 Tax=Rhodobacter sp. NTK016B TaxID=2759676 RepID=UPI001A8E40AB|nr:hypothetical protein [Rhodobacter sp. NTK016B]MBN8292652.1 hypothetical protein [Rhodobacter sp. NTK016B]